MFSEQDHFFMRRALLLANTACEQNEVPVGAVLVRQNEVIAEGWNCPISLNDPTAHAEVIALRKGAEKVGNYRLIDTTLYVTLEPCMMCVGAMVQARIKRLVYGAWDKKAGAIVSQATLREQAFLNHQIEHVGGLYRDECAALLSNFFKIRRQRVKE